jgi:hypothetical protein
VTLRQLEFAQSQASAEVHDEYVRHYIVWRLRGADHEYAHEQAASGWS